MLRKTGRKIEREQIILLKFWNFLNKFLNLNETVTNICIVTSIKLYALSSVYRPCYTNFSGTLESGTQMRISVFYNLLFPNYCKHKIQKCSVRFNTFFEICCFFVHLTAFYIPCSVPWKTCKQVLFNHFFFTSLNFKGLKSKFVEGHVLTYSYHDKLKLTWY